MYLLVLGGNSDIGIAVARQYAKRDGAHIMLASRNMEALEKKAKDLSVRYQVKVSTFYFDAADFQSHPVFYEKLDPKPDGIVLAFGYTNDQILAQQDFEEAHRSITVNYTGAVSILETAAVDFSRKQRGFIVGISSVAGDRGRQSNYVYGSSKAALTAYLSGLRNRLQKYGVQVLTVKPGFVRTKMTAAMDLPERLVLKPEKVAGIIYQGQKRHRDIVYTGWLWWSIMFIIRHIPEKIFKRLSL